MNRTALLILCLLNLTHWLADYTHLSTKWMLDDLLSCDNPVGDNDSKLKEVSLLCTDVISCWGSFKQATDRITKVSAAYPNSKCFGKNKNGTPFHPLALMYNGTQKNPQLINCNILE